MQMLCMHTLLPLDPGCCTATCPMLHTHSLVIMRGGYKSMHAGKLRGSRSFVMIDSMRMRQDDAESALLGF